MVLYECDRCGWTSNRKPNFKRHLLRKYPCSPVKNDIELADIYKKYFNEYPPDYYDKWSDSDDDIDTDMKTDMISNISRFLCRKCEREFNHYQNRWRHEKICNEHRDEKVTKLNTLIAS